MAEIIGNRDGKRGENNTYKVGSRGKVPRPTVVKEVDNKKHPGFFTAKINSKKYVKANPDDSESNNVNR